MLILLLGLVVLMVIGVILFLNFSPAIGGTPSEKDQLRYAQIAKYKNGKFLNEVPTNMDMDAKTMLSTLKQFIVGVKNSEPDFDIPVQVLDSLQLREMKSKAQVIWFGHSTFLVQIAGKNILLDPMFGNVPAPHDWLGKKRYSDSLPIEIENLPQIDLVLLSHDHYDHLDHGSILKLIKKTKLFFVPLGVGAHLKAWGVSSNQIKELNWWDEQHLKGLQIIFTPSRHFSGRGITDRFSTLWGSWVIKSEKQRIYFSGDGGYGPHFKTIGQQHGPFDFAMIECGQYHKNWADIHMMPEESVQAGIDLNTKLAMPIHWGAFTLSLHSWIDPVERFLKEAKALKLPVITPQIGEIITVGNEHDQNNHWWYKP